MEINKIYNMDCLEGLKMLDDNCIDLTVTSPPYDDLRKYNGYSFDFENIAKELYRVTKDGGVVVWIIGDQTTNFNESGTSFKQTLYFKEIGFNLLDTMIYLKANYPPAYPNMKRYANQFEYMFVFSKGKPKTFNPKQVPKADIRSSTAKITIRQKDGSLKERIADCSKTTKNATNVWCYSTGGNTATDKIAFKHPAIFPEKLAQDHILSWSNEGDIVMDIFMGSGTTAKMALLNNRQFIGFEISKEYCDIAYNRINGYIYE